MNRATTRTQRRAWAKRRTSELRAEGCRCTPIVHPAEPDEWAKSKGAVSGELIEHQRGCPLGNAVLEMNRAGMYPAMFSYWAGCSR